MDIPAQMCHLVTIATKVINVIFALIPIGGFAVLVYGVFLKITASDDPQKVEKSTKTLTTGIAGIVLGLSAVVLIFTLETTFLEQSSGIANQYSLLEGDYLNINFCVEGYYDACNPDPCPTLHGNDPTTYGTICCYDQYGGFRCLDAASGATAGGQCHY